jgi:hypothetical protein
MPGTIGWANQVLSRGGGLRWRSRSSSPDFTGQISLPGFSGSHADRGGALVVVASLAAPLGSLGPQHPVHNHWICLATYRC